MEFVSESITSCSKEQTRLYQTWFNFADSGYLFSVLNVSISEMIASLNIWYLIDYAITDRDGRLTTNDAMSFFAMSHLSKPELKQV